MKVDELMNVLPSAFGTIKTALQIIIVPAEGIVSVLYWGMSAYDPSLLVPPGSFCSLAAVWNVAQRDLFQTLTFRFRLPSILAFTRCRPCSSGSLPYQETRLAQELITVAISGQTSLHFPLA